MYSTSFGTVHKRRELEVSVLEMTVNFKLAKSMVARKSLPNFQKMHKRYLVKGAAPRISPLTHNNNLVHFRDKSRARRTSNSIQSFSQRI